MTTSQALIERRQGSHRAIQQLVGHRTEMLALYGELAGMRPFTATNGKLLSKLQLFCQSLIDYTADAHFRLYKYIDNGAERRMSAAKVADHVYPRISSSTQRILDFNEKYDNVDHSADHIGELEGDLSILGERLADRIELEDKLIDVLSHSRD